MKVSIETDPPRDEIEEFIDSCIGATFFHSPDWLDCLVNSFNQFESFWMVARNRGRIESIMPVIKVIRWPFYELWSLPFGTYGGPIGGEPATHRMILERFQRLERKWRCIQSGIELFNMAFVEYLPDEPEWYTEECRIVDLVGGYQEFWEGKINKKRRQICNRADRKGLTVKPIEKISELNALYSLYRKNSVSWGGVHPYPFRLFHELFRRQNRGVLILGAYMEGRLLGGHVDFFYGVMAQAWQAGLSEEANDYGVGAVLIREAVREACQRGMKLFNLGSSGGDEGIIFFKESMGGEEYNYPAIRDKKRWFKWIMRR